tara:strand:+ start:12035 stop:12301 length:267 start_codon:yes stop_codon:yes gene_type:complete
MLRNEKKPPCKCGSVSKLKRPIPRFPKQAENENKEKTIDTVHSEFNDLKKKRINRYRYILTRMRDDSQVKTKPQVISGFLPFTPMYQR